MKQTQETNPSARYNQTGSYDEEAYNRDLVDFPEYFDQNGWPLFGYFDPYALVHPFTGRPWYEAPRIPRKNESIPDYEAWFGLAVDFNQALDDLAEQERLTPQTVVPNSPNGSDAHYLPKSDFAFLGNISYCRKHILPELTSMMAARAQTASLPLLWGECKELIGALPISLARAKRREEGILGAKTRAKDAQLKWYIHFRDYYVKVMKLTVYQVNKLFLLIVSDIVKGRVSPPPGFDVDWFRQTQGRKKSDSETVKSGLAEILLRFKTDKRTAELRRSLPTEEPIIPPIDAAFYGRDYRNI